MSFTTLRKSESGVLFLSQHFERLFAGVTERSDLERQVRERLKAGPAGLYSVNFAEGALTFRYRERSRVFDGIPTRRLVSPFASATEPPMKSPSPSPYDAVRAEGIATLLTDEHAREFLESCTSGILAWNGSEVLAVPDGRPRVQSIAEQHLVTQLNLGRASIPAGADWPLLLVNAVGCVEPRNARPFPADLRTEIEQMYARAVVALD